MSDAAGSWPADPDDPQCPHCGEPVSATADYCMHCYEDLPDPAPAGAADDGGGEPATADAGAAGTTEAVETTTTAETASSSSTAGEQQGLLHPDSLLDDSMTVFVGIAAGVLLGATVTTALAFALPGGWPFLLGGIAWLLGTVVVARNRTVFDAAQMAGYLLALVLVVLPVTVSAAAPMADPNESRVGLAVVMAIFTWPIAAVLAGVGWFLGRWGSGGEEG